MNKSFGDYALKPGRIPTVTKDDYLNQITWVFLRTQASFNLPCCSCGTFDDVHQHHIRHIRKEAYQFIPEEMSYKRILALRNRKQIPLCKDCHLNLVHQGKYSGFKLSKFHSPRMFDNRIVHIESFVKPGKEYHSKKLEDRGWKEVDVLKAR